MHSSLASPVSVLYHVPDGVPFRFTARRMNDISYLPFDSDNRRGV